MSENKFTPGSWSVDYDNENEPSIIRTDKRAHPKDAIAIVFSKSSGIEEAEHNAKLIAAAPELLQALIEAREMLITKGMNEDSVGLIGINNVIKKATE